MAWETAMLVLCALLVLSVAVSADNWWDGKWRYRTIVERPTPYRDGARRPVEVAADLPRLLREAGVAGEFDPASVRVVERGPEGEARVVPHVLRTEYDARRRREQSYLAWWAQARVGERGRYEIYFDTTDRGMPPAPEGEVPPENLLINPSFEEEREGLPAGWTHNGKGVVSLARFAHTTGQRSLKIEMGPDTPEQQRGEVVISQMVDVAQYAGQEVVFEADLMATRGIHGTPVTIEIQQFRADGSRILDYAVQPRWLTVELAQGHLVQFSERGCFNPQVARANVVIRLRPYCGPADDGRQPSDEERTYEVYVDRLVLRPGERWPWPGANEERFVEGALQAAPLNRAVDFTGVRRLQFAGASQGTLTAGTFNPDANADHWGCQAGTLEMWIKPHWSSGDGEERQIFYAKSYMHHLHSRLRQLANGDLEFTIADADGVYHTIAGPGGLQAETWHHLAVTWDYPRAQLQLFVDGVRVAAEGPGAREWPWTLDPRDPRRDKGRGISDSDRRSMPMQATLGGDDGYRRPVDAVIDEFRISSIARYQRNFDPPRTELAADEHTRALFHFENECDGTHYGDDQFVEGYFCHELPPVREAAVLEVLEGADVRRHEVVVNPPGDPELYARNRAEAVMQVRRPLVPLPDPRFIEQRQRIVEATVSGQTAPLQVRVEGDLPPVMLWESYERGEGAGQTTTLTPRWRANDNVVPFTAEDLRATLAQGIEDDPQKAIAIFRYLLQTTNYFDAPYCESHRDRLRKRVSYRLIKDLNIYPFDQCGPLNHVARKLFLECGISSNDCPGTHHQFEQAFFHGSLRLFDLSPRKFWLDRDNETIASLRDIYRDPWLKVRDGENIMAYIPGPVRGASFGSALLPHRIDLPLRPGERVSIGWHNEGRWSELGGERERIPLAKIPPHFGNGAIVFQPTGPGEATALDNLRIESPGQIRAEDALTDAALTYRLVCPYLLSAATLRARYRAESEDAVRVWLSFDEGANWKQVWRSSAREGALALDLSDEVMARYDYWLKLELAGGSMAQLSDLQIRTVFVNSALSLPGTLRLGDNTLSFVAGPATEPVTARLAWVERYRSDLGVALNGIGYYNMDDQNYRHLFVCAPGGTTTVTVTLFGRPFQGEVALQGLAPDWVVAPNQQVTLGAGEASATAHFPVRAVGASAGDIVPFEVVVREGERERRLWAQLLVAAAALVSEAEAAQASGEVACTEDPALSGGAVMTFTGTGELAFSANAPAAGKYALWVRTRRDEGASTALGLTVDGQRRDLRLTAMIGFSDWDNPDAAHAKMFAHYGEAFGHWNWYRVPDVELTAGPHRLALTCSAGAQVDAVLLVPQTPELDRATMNLMHNWNFAPWYAAP